MHTNPLKHLIPFITFLAATKASPTPNLSPRTVPADWPATASIIIHQNSTGCDDSPATPPTIIPSGVCISTNATTNLAVSAWNIQPVTTTPAGVPAGQTFNGVCGIIIWENGSCNSEYESSWASSIAVPETNELCVTGVIWPDTGYTSSVFGSFKLSCTVQVPNPPPSPYVQHYGMCGGIGYTGNTVCQPPWVCTVDNPYFSMCL